MQVVEHLSPDATQHILSFLQRSTRLHTLGIFQGPGGDNDRELRQVVDQLLWAAAHQAPITSFHCNVDLPVTPAVFSDFIQRLTEEATVSIYFVQLDLALPRPMLPGKPWLDCRRSILSVRH